MILLINFKLLICPSCILKSVLPLLFVEHESSFADRIPMSLDMHSATVITDT